MFTGLIETIGTVKKIDQMELGARLFICPAAALDDVRAGDSLSVNGACLTVEKTNGGLVQLSAVSETLSRTTLRYLRPGHLVNLERACKIGDRLGGHYVTGHVDCVGVIASEERKGISIERWIKTEERSLPQIVEKGSVTVDGISLTVARKKPWGFSVALVPHTLSVTPAGNKKTGNQVNIETDILAKYAGNAIGAYSGKLNFETMKAMGY
jgi:riboflavin synthase